MKVIRAGRNKLPFNAVTRSRAQAGTHLCFGRAAPISRHFVRPPTTSNSMTSWTYSLACDASSPRLPASEDEKSSSWRGSWTRSSRAAWILPEAEERGEVGQRGSATRSGWSERTEEVASEGVGLDEGLREGLVTDGEPLERPNEPPVVAALDDGRLERRDIWLWLVRSGQRLKRETTNWSADY